MSSALARLRTRWHYSDGSFRAGSLGLQYEVFLAAHGWHWRQLPNGRVSKAYTTGERAMEGAERHFAHATGAR